MNKLGIIGGMGPLATADFFRRIIEKTDAKKDQEHIDIILSNHASIPDRTTVILKNQDPSIVIDVVKEDIKLMEMANVANIAIPCNTFHYFYDMVDSLTDINIIHMPKEALKEFKNLYGSRVAVLSTPGTRDAKVYEKQAKDLGMELINIDEYMDSIHELIYYVKETNDLSGEGLRNIIKEIENKYNPDGYILACTELSIIDKDPIKEYTTLDAMDILVRESIIKSGYPYKNE